MSDCNVCLDQDDGEACTVWNVETRKARKAHKCYECDDEIPVGAEHQYVSTLFEGHWDTYRTCLACVEVHRAMTSCGREDGSAGYRLLGILWDDLREHVFPEMNMACVTRCETAEARAKLLTRWNDWKFR